MVFIDTGSVGRPTDGDWRAGHVLLEVDDRGIHVRFVRIEYDIEAAAGDIVAAGLPKEFAELLRSGGTLGARASVG